MGAIIPVPPSESFREHPDQQETDGRRDYLKPGTLHHVGPTLKGVGSPTAYIACSLRQELNYTQGSDGKQVYSGLQRCWPHRSALPGSLLDSGICLSRLGGTRVYAFMRPSRHPVQIHRNPL